MPARHERILEDHVAGLLGPDHDAGGRQIDLEPAIRTVDDAELRGVHAGARRDRVRDPGDDHLAITYLARCGSGSAAR